MTDDTHDQATNHLGPPRVKDPAAVSLGRKGGKAGTGASKRRSARHYERAGRRMGKLAAARMTPQQRIDRARKANAARSAKRQANSSGPG